MSSKIQNEDVKSLTDITGAGGTASQLINDTKIYDTLNGQQLSQSIANGQLGGGGSINYIKNPGAESATTGWATYSDAAQNIPVDGTGGTATGLTFTRSTTTPLIGSGQFSLAKDAANRQGKGVSYDFTIDRAYQATTLGISFNYNAGSLTVSNGITAPNNDGTTSTNAGNSDIEIFIYDVTNAVLIPVSPQVITGNGSNNFIFNGTFQTSSNSTSYRLIFHIATASTSAWTFLFDGVTVGPQKLVSGTPVTDWQSYTPTIIGFGSTTVYDSQWKRVGDSLKIKATFLMGTVSGSTASISLPSGLTLDSSKLSSSGNSVVGFWEYNRTNASTPKRGPILAAGGGTTLTFSTDAYAETENALTSMLGNKLASSLIISLLAEVPILGWSSNVQMSNNTSSSVVAARGYRNASLTNLAPNGSGVKVSLDAIDGDTNGAFDTSNGRYVVQVAGWYKISACITLASTNVLANLYQCAFAKNGSVVSYGQQYNASSATAFRVKEDYMLQLVPGDYIELYLYGAGNNSSSQLTATTGATNTFLEIHRISGPSTIAVTDTVACSYWASANTSTSTSTPVNFDSKVFDTTGSVTTGSGWKFTAPISGKYLITGYVNLSGTGGINGQLYKNGSTYSVICWLPTGAAESFSYTINLLAGDYIDIRTTGAATITGNATQSNAASSNIQISRIGN